MFQLKMKPQCGALLLWVYNDKQVWLQPLRREWWHLGLKDSWYDGPIKMFGLGPVEIVWHYEI